MNIFQVKHLPVIDEQGKLLGIVSDDDILVRNFNETLESFNLDLQEVHVSPDQHIFDIIHILSKQDISLIPIVKEGIYKGSIRKQDVISFLGNGFSFSFPGSIIELGIQKNNYSLVEISQIVEAENAKILSVFIRETTNEESKLKVILKINKNNISNCEFGFINLMNNCLNSSSWICIYYL